MLPVTRSPDWHKEFRIIPVRSITGKLIWGKCYCRFIYSCLFVSYVKNKKDVFEEKLKGR